MEFSKYAILAASLCILGASSVNAQTTAACASTGKDEQSTVRAKMPNDFSNNLPAPRLTLSISTGITSLAPPLPPTDEEETRDSAQKDERAGAVFEVDQGSLLVARQETSTVKAADVCINVAADAAAFVVRVGNDILVANFLDCHQGDIRVNLGEKQVAIPMGRALLIVQADNTPHEDSMASILDGKSVSKICVHGDQTLFMGRIAYASALKNCPQLHQFINSGEKEERKLASKILKASAACSTLSTGN